MYGVSPPLADLVDRDDVRVVQGRGGARLLLEAGEPARVLRKLFGKDLQRHLAAQAQVGGNVNLAHTSGPEG